MLGFGALQRAEDFETGLLVVDGAAADDGAQVLCLRRIAQRQRRQDTERGAPDVGVGVATAIFMSSSMFDALSACSARKAAVRTCGDASPLS